MIDRVHATEQDQTAREWRLLLDRVGTGVLG
jgi:hypothetical protein